MAPSSPIVLQYGSLKIFINDVAALGSVLATLRLDAAAASCSNTGDSQVKSLTRTTSSASDRSSSLSTHDGHDDLVPRDDHADWYDMCADERLSVGIQTVVHAHASLSCCTQTEMVSIDSHEAEVQTDAPTCDLTHETCTQTDETIFTKSELDALVSEISGVYEKKIIMALDAQNDMFMSTIQKKMPTCEFTRISSWADASADEPASSDVVSGDVASISDCDGDAPPEIPGCETKVRGRKIHRRSRVRAS
eukprot:TRINITY_DN5911_c1_g2_i1.p1 TRINITY_DN5911_c1_g2~~TRINITY_DN5911_c1_g2_i1.p1  ORF type:complete len:277 (+),score=22.33 TRINITY_DN5911_c1_g2_i1:84-833(+)